MGTRMWACDPTHSVAGAIEWMGHGRLFEQAVRDLVRGDREGGGGRGSGQRIADWGHCEGVGAGGCRNKVHGNRGGLSRGGVVRGAALIGGREGDAGAASEGVGGNGECVAAVGERAIEAGERASGERNASSSCAGSAGNGDRHIERTIEGDGVRCGRDGDGWSRQRGCR